MKNCNKKHSVVNENRQNSSRRMRLFFILQLIMSLTIFNALGQENIKDSRCSSFYLELFSF